MWNENCHDVNSYASTAHASHLHISAVAAAAGDVDEHDELRL